MPSEPGPGAPVPRLETERLVLRAWTPDDVGAYARMLADREVTRHLGFGLRHRIKRTVAEGLGRVSHVEARRSVTRLDEHWRQHGFGEWAAEERETGKLAGQIGLNHHADWTASATRVEVGWMLARDAWGRGYATEGARAALQFAFDDLGLERVISIAKPDNVRSLRVMERLGMWEEGRTRWKGGEVAWWVVDREAWRAS